jgi:hypothetical protein
VRRERGGEGVAHRGLDGGAPRIESPRDEAPRQRGVRRFVPRDLREDSHDGGIGGGHARGARLQGRERLADAALAHDRGGDRGEIGPPGEGAVHAERARSELALAVRAREPEAELGVPDLVAQGALRVGDQRGGRADRDELEDETSERRDARVLVERVERPRGGQGRPRRRIEAAEVGRDARRPVGALGRLRDAGDAGHDEGTTLARVGVAIGEVATGVGPRRIRPARDRLHEEAARAGLDEIAKGRVEHLARRRAGAAPVREEELVVAEREPLLAVRDWRVADERAGARRARRHGPGRGGARAAAARAHLDDGLAAAGGEAKDGETHGLEQRAR